MTPLDEKIRQLLTRIDEAAPPAPPFEALTPLRDRTYSTLGATARFTGRRKALVAAIAACVIAAGGIIAVRTNHRSSPTDNVPVTAQVTEPTEPATTSPPTADAARIRTVRPAGVRSGPLPMRIYEAVADGPSGPDVALVYDLRIGFDSGGRIGTIEPPAATSDGQLSIEMGCVISGCGSFQPTNDEIIASIRLVVRRGAVALTAGQHDAPFRLHFDDGESVDFTVSLFADAGPSPTIGDRVKTSTGEPTEVQTVFDVGRFAYHAVSGFGSIWILGKSSDTVTRLDGATGAVIATISLGDRVGQPDRLAVGSDAVFVSANPAVRIDPQTNTTATFGAGSPSRAVIADGQTSWTAGLEGIERLDADGTVTRLDLPVAPWMDLAIANNMVWALSQIRGNNHLIAFDKTTGKLRHDIAIVTDDTELPVRLVADERTVVVGVDTSGGGGRTGKVVLVDPSTADITATLALSSRPEGIVLTDRHIWTSGAVLDRSTLAVTDISLGFTIARGPDGSIWGIQGTPGSATGESIAVRFAPGDFAG